MSKSILITGATSGFGEACARRFAKEGWRLILAARRKDRLKALQEKLGGEKSVHIMSLDVRDQEAVMTGLTHLPEKFSEVDVLVNNAGLALGLEPAHASDMSDWNTMVDTNIKGLMYCTRAMMPGMAEQGDACGIDGVPFRLTPARQIHGEPLFGDGIAVLQPGVADIPLRDAG